MVQRSSLPGLDRRAFASRLNVAMSDAHLTKRDLAEKVGAHHNRVGEWARGTRWPSIRHLASLAHVLNVDLDWLLLGRPPDAAPVREAASAKRAIELARELAELAPPLVLIAERAAHITASSAGQGETSSRTKKTREPLRNNRPE